jgi:hypothetical protein
LTKKLTCPWKGPFRIVELMGTNNVNAKLRSVGGKDLKQIVHVSRLKPYISPVRPTEDIMLEDEDTFNWEEEEDEPKGKEIKAQKKEAKHQRKLGKQMRDVKEDSPMEIEPQSSAESYKENLTHKNEWEVEKILAARKLGGQLKYLVKWKGYAEDGNTWEPEENLENAKERVNEFYKVNGLECPKCNFRATSSKGLRNHKKSNHVN